MLPTFEALKLSREKMDFPGKLLCVQLNKEFVEALSEHLIGRGLVLEVGAGNGLLSKELRERGIDIIAIDDDSWGLCPEAEVEELDYREAIKKYRPTVILCCWMPLEEDWTRFFRRFKCVQEYILICGNNECGSDSTWEEHHGWKAVTLEKPTSYLIRISNWDHSFDFNRYDEFRRRYEVGHVDSFRREEQ